MQQYIYAHRGASGFAPENTMAAFNLATQKGADGIECDVHLTKDKQLVVIHDPILDRTTNGVGFVKDFTLSEIKKLDAGDGENVPLLSEVVDLVGKFNKKLIIEFKTDPVEDAIETAQILAKFLQEQKLFSDITILSFWVNAVNVIREILPESILVGPDIYIGLSSSELISLAKIVNANVLSIDWIFLPEGITDLAKENNITLCSYALNDQTSFDFAKNLGVEVLLTDFPGKFHL